MRLETKQHFKNTASPLLMMYFQKEIEEKAFTAGGGNFVAPAQRMVDFTEDIFSSTLPHVLIFPASAHLTLKKYCLHLLITGLKKLLKSFAKKMPAKNGKTVIIPMKP